MLLALILQVVAQPAAFVDVSVIPIVRPGVIPHQTVIVRDGRIAWIGPAAKAVVPTDAVRIDGRGQYLLPGFADMHTHPGSPFDLYTYLANGITRIRVMWGDTATLRWRRDGDAGTLPAPRIVTAGAIIDGNPPSQPSMKVLTDPALARAEVTAQHLAGFDFIKVYNSVPRAVYDTIVTVARELGMPVAGHVPFAAGLRGALAAHQASIEHLRGYIAELVPKDAPIQPGATLRSRTLAWNNIDRTRFSDLVKRTIAAGVGNVPTFVVGALDMLPSAEYRQLMARPEVALIGTDNAPDRSKVSYLADYTDADFRESGRAVEPQLELTRALFRGGARLMIGTDSWLSGFAFHEELLLYERAGIPRADILRLATHEPAVFLGKGATQGAVAVGYDADLQLVGGNPIETLDRLKDRRGVMIRGVWFPRDRLDRTLRDLAPGLHPLKPEPPIDRRSYALGAIGAFAEMVGGGVKRLALSEVLTPEEADGMIAEAERIAERNHARIYREPDLIVTDLFPADVAKDRHVLVIYRGTTLDDYQSLKRDRADLVRTGQYGGAARREIAWRFGKLLSYPDARIEALLAGKP